VQNGLADGSMKSDQMLAVVDEQLVLSPSDFKPNADPPSWVAAQVLDGKQKKSATGHAWTATLYGNRVPSQVTIQLRVAK
jgi:hypothetical protein